MSTRSTTKFAYTAPVVDGEDQKPVATIYRHSDGYPESMLPALLKFFKAVEDETDDLRYSDPSYLAAKWVVWLARMFSTPYDVTDPITLAEKVGSLDFTSVGVLDEDPGDIQWIYWLDCSTMSFGRPQVYYKPAHEGPWELAESFKPVEGTA